jgi:hypothetical protein
MDCRSNPNRILSPNNRIEDRLMPHIQMDGFDEGYEMITYDTSGVERTDDPDGWMSRRVLNLATNSPVTDVFVMSHAWKGDIPTARKQYDAWNSTMLRRDEDILRARNRPGFQSLFVVLHWPSQPWGDEEFGTTAEFSTPARPEVIEALIDAYAARIADTPVARRALRTILTAVNRQPIAAALPPDVLSAYRVLDQEAALGSAGEGAAAGADREPFDPEQRFQAARFRSTLSLSGPEYAASFLSPLRQLSFWKMQDRGRRIGESAAHDLLQALLGIRSDLRIHLMGHGFGCILLSAAVAGPVDRPGLLRPVQSLVLVQGALSLWSYCEDIPYRRGMPGYFRRVIADSRVAGPIVTTQSCFDTAVGRWYPLAAGAARQIGFASGELPRYGGSGTFGMRGPGLNVVDVEIKATDQPYDFGGNRIFNLESSSVIRNGGGASGAHNDIDHPEVAHAVWSAALA